MRLRGRVWAVPGVRASRGAEPYGGKATCLQMENLVAQGGKASSPRSFSVEGAELGFQYFFLVQLQDVPI